MIAAYGIFLVPEGAIDTGLLNAAGYARYAVVGAIVMFAAVLVSALGTHNRIIHAYAAEIDPPKSAETFRQMLAVMRFRPFLLLLFAGVFAFAAQGLIFSLTPYLLTHVWEFDQGEFVRYAIVLFVSVTFAFFLVTPISRRLGKPKAASRLTIMATLFGIAPYLLRYFDMFPANGTPAMIPLLYVARHWYSRRYRRNDPDHVDDGGRGRWLRNMPPANERRESFPPACFSCRNAVPESAYSLRVRIIQLSQLPEGSARQRIFSMWVQSLILMFVSLIAVIGALGAWAYTRFPLSEADHLHRISQL